MRSLRTFAGPGLQTLCLFIGLWLGGAGLGAEVEEPPLERMRYEMQWKGLTVGETVMEVRLTDEGVFRTFRVESSGVVSWFKTVEYQIDSLSTDAFVRVKKRIRDGKYSQTDELWIADGHAAWKEEGRKEVMKYEVPEGVTDYVSLLQTMRGADLLSPGESRKVMLAMDGGLHALTVKAVRRKKLEWKGRKTPATLHELTTSSKVLFSRNTPRGFWLADEFNLILKMEIQTRYGRVRAHLAEWKRNGVEVEYSSSEADIQ